MPRTSRRNWDEFPELAELGLKTVTIAADGNCMFSAFSDQIYGHVGRSAEIRARVIQYMRENPKDFKYFIQAEVGGGTRRNPKRKNVAAPIDTNMPAEERIDIAFRHYLDNMAQNGVFGDNLELNAFSKAYGYDIRIFRKDFSYITQASETESHPLIYIALNDFEHYSSVRNINGPFTGLPNVKPEEKPQKRGEPKVKQTKGVVIQDWEVNRVRSSLPFAISEATARKALSENDGDFDATVTKLLDEPTSASTTPGTPGSLSGASSVERDQDDEDEKEAYGPNKRQDRKKSVVKEKDIPTLSPAKPAPNPKKPSPPPSCPIKIPSSPKAKKFTPPPTPGLPSSTTPSLLIPREPKPEVSDSDRASPVGSVDSASDNSILGTSPTTYSRLALRKLARTPSPSSSPFLAAVPDTEKKPCGKLITAREKKELAKRAQKEARRERSKTENQKKVSATSKNGGKKSGSTSGNTNTKTPPEIGEFKTMYI